MKYSNKMVSPEEIERQNKRKNEQYRMYAINFMKSNPSEIKKINTDNFIKINPFLYERKPEKRNSIRYFNFRNCYS